MPERVVSMEAEGPAPGLGSPGGSGAGGSGGPPGDGRPTRYFIMKSLNMANIEQSLAKGIWATQRHNEVKLQEAFHTSAAVFLVFSVNSSGHFQGYAKMTGPVTAQQGGARWEGAAMVGSVFGVAWQRRFDLPLRDTEHLRNTLNEDKPVKISRDGQELPPDLGAALCLLFEEGAQAAGIPRPATTGTYAPPRGPAPPPGRPPPYGPAGGAVPGMGHPMMGSMGMMSGPMGMMGPGMMDPAMMHPMMHPMGFNPMMMGAHMGMMGPGGMGYGHLGPMGMGGMAGLPPGGRPEPPSSDDDASSRGGHPSPRGGPPPRGPPPERLLGPPRRRPHDWPDNDVGPYGRRRARERSRSAERGRPRHRHHHRSPSYSPEPPPDARYRGSSRGRPPGGAPRNGSALLDLSYDEYLAMYKSRKGHREPEGGGRSGRAPDGPQRPPRREPGLSSGGGGSAPMPGMAPALGPGGAPNITEGEYLRVWERYCQMAGQPFDPHVVRGWFRAYQQGVSKQLM